MLQSFVTVLPTYDTFRYCSLHKVLLGHQIICHFPLTLCVNFLFFPLIPWKSGSDSTSPLLKPKCVRLKLISVRTNNFVLIQPHRSCAAATITDFTHACLPHHIPQEDRYFIFMTYFLWELWELNVSNYKLSIRNVARSSMKGWDFTASRICNLDESS